MIEKLKEVIKNINKDIDLSTVSEQSRLVEDLGLDSMSIMLMAMEIESAFNYTFTGPVNFVTVKDVCDFLKSKNIA